jgi:hypothetical protein
MHGEVRSAHTILPDNTKENDHLGRPGVDVSMRLKWILMIIGCEGGDWIQLSLDRVQLHFFVNTVMKR